MKRNLWTYICTKPMILSISTVPFVNTEAILSYTVAIVSLIYYKKKFSMFNLFAYSFEVVWLFYLAILTSLIDYVSDHPKWRININITAFHFFWRSCDSVNNIYDISQSCDFTNNIIPPWHYRWKHVILSKDLVHYRLKLILSVKSVTSIKTTILST